MGQFFAPSPVGVEAVAEPEVPGARTIPVLTPGHEDPPIQIDAQLPRQGRAGQMRLERGRRGVRAAYPEENVYRRVTSIPPPAVYRRQAGRLVPRSRARREMRTEDETPRHFERVARLDSEERMKASRQIFQLDLSIRQYGEEAVLEILAERSSSLSARGSLTGTWRTANRIGRPRTPCHRPAARRSERHSPHERSTGRSTSSATT